MLASRAVVFVLITNTAVVVDADKRNGAVPIIKLAVVWSAGVKTTIGAAPYPTLNVIVAKVAVVPSEAVPVVTPTIPPKSVARVTLTTVPAPVPNPEPLAIVGAVEPPIKCPVVFIFPL